MASKRITDLTLISTIDTAVDPLPIVDISDTSQAASGTTKKVTVDQIESSIFGATGSKAIVVDNVAALKALTVASVDDGQVFLTRGYYTENDGGQGTYIYDTASSAADNGGTVIAPTTGSGRYLLQYSESINVKQFGARGNGISNDTQAFQNAASVAGSLVNVYSYVSGIRIKIPNGTYIISDQITLQSGTSFEGTNGADRGNCSIYLTANSKNLFFIGENKKWITIKNVYLGSLNPATSVVSTGTVGIKAEGNYPNSSFYIRIEGVIFEQFNKGIYINGLSFPGQWQCDNWVVDQCVFSLCGTGIHVNTQNFDYSRIANCGFGIGANQVGVFLERSGSCSFYDCAAGGSPGSQPTAIFCKADISGITKFVSCQGEQMGEFYKQFNTSGYTLYTSFEDCTFDNVNIRLDVNTTTCFQNCRFQANILGLATAPKITLINNIFDPGYSVSLPGASYINKLESGSSTVQQGDFVVATSGYGIDFSATGNGSGTPTSEKFTDYEEGTCNLVFNSWTNTGTPTISATYTKIGRIVNVFALINPSGGTISSSLYTSYLSGLPYTPTARAISRWNNGTDIGATYTGSIVATDGKIFSPEILSTSNLIVLQITYQA